MTKTARQNPQFEHFPGYYSSEVERFIMRSIEEERREASNELLLTLILSGLSIEVCVVIISYFLAEFAIKPVKESYESQKLFIANASHEIKTPLAAISANLEAADLSENKWIKNVEEETRKITNLNNSLLKLARADILSTVHESERVDLKNIIEKELKTFAPRIELADKEISLKKNLDSCVINVNKADFCELLNILLDNALKYCESSIEIVLKNSNLIVKNDGKLIPKEKQPHIFDRFYQVDKSTEGVGLGLSIAYSISERNRWQIQVSTREGFNIFTVIL